MVRAIAMGPAVKRSGTGPRVWALAMILALLSAAPPAEAVRLTGEIFLGDLNDVFFGAGDHLVLVIDPVTGTTTIDEAASSITMLGSPIHLGFSGSFDPATGIYSGTGTIDAPQVSIVTGTDHADGEVQEAGTGAGAVDLLDGVGIGAPFSLFMNSGCDPVGAATTTDPRIATARHFIECGISLFLSGFVAAEDFGDVDCTTVPEGARCEDGDACTAGDACTGGVCAPGAPASCDDGDPCTSDGCDVTSGCFHTGGDGDADGVCDDADNCPRTANPEQTDIDPADGIGDACECRAAAPGVCVLDGVGAPASECLTELRVEPVPAVDARSQRPATRVECADGTACDLDGIANRSCRFRVALCFGNRDPRVACLAPPLETFRLRAPASVSRRSHEALAAAALLGAAAGISTVAVEGRRGDRLRFTPPLAIPDVCTAPVTIDVPLAGRRGRLRVAARTEGVPVSGDARPPRDGDRLRLICRE